jgi:hypothetical protein
MAAAIIANKLQKKRGYYALGIRLQRKLLESRLTRARRDLNPRPDA